MSASSSKAKSSRKSKGTSQEEIEPSGEWLDRFAGYWLRFDRFGWDFLGVALCALGLITLFGLFGWTAGSFISPWTNLLLRWTGWGSYLLAVAMLYLGVAALIRRTGRLISFSLGQVLAAECFLFALLGLLALLGGRSLDRAEAGLDGGVLGWGLAELISSFIPPPLNTVVMTVLLVVFLWGASGLNAWIRSRMQSWVEAGPPPVPDEVEEEEGDFEPGAIAAAGATREKRPSTRRKQAPSEDESPLAPVGLIPDRPADLPPLSLLSEERTAEQDTDQIKSIGLSIVKTLAEFGVPAKVVGYRVGPTVTQYAIEPGYLERQAPDGQAIRQKVRVSQISALSRDLARALSAERLRIEAPVPGHSYVGVEVPNTYTSLVRLRPILESEAFHRLGSPLAIALGKDVSGKPMVADLGQMPHLLVAGTTGSGKSVCIAAITTCLVMNNSPADLRLAMLDPKMVELVRFNGMPHLLGKVETKVDRMLGVLQWAISEMDRRYRLLEEVRSRDIDTYNRKLARRKKPTLPRIVILIDELADLMMSAPDQTEHSLVRLAQMARATGIHLVVATQRPSTDVVTGVIKANFPARIAFTVASSVDSRVILDANGAETLLGRGDMLFLSPDVGLPQRAQGVMVSDQEVNQVIAYWQQESEQSPEPGEAPWEDLLKVSDEDSDALVEQAVALVRRTQRASASFLQRQLRIGYPRAARLLDQLEEMGVVGAAVPGGREREVLVDPEDDDETNDEWNDA